MHFSGNKDHFLTVSTPGGRDTIAIFTKYNEKEALKLIDKAERIIFTDHAPSKISDNPSWYECKFCDFSDVCHNNIIPKVTCRTCLHSTPEENGTWSCAIGDWKKIGCEKHLFLPDLIGEAVESSSQWVKYRDGRVNYEGGTVENA
jgi:hypothetical protein